MSMVDNGILSYKIFFFGDTKVGKTSFILRMSEGTFQDSMVATMGCDSKKKKVPLENGQTAIIEMWDTAGQERFKSITRNLIKKADGVILLYSIIDRTSFENVTQWLTDIKSNGKSCIPVILVGNKYDLNQERLVSTEEGQSIANMNDIPFFEASCKDAFNLSNIFNHAVKTIYDKQNFMKDVDVCNRISVSKASFLPEKKKKCC